VKKFKSKGYKVAAVSRNPTLEVKGSADLVLSADFNDPSSIAGVFQRVDGELGIPNVVVYNAYSSLPLSNDNPLQRSVDDFIKDMNINTISAYAAAQEAVKGFEKLPFKVQKTFMFTGNILNTATSPTTMSFGAGKFSSWYIIYTLAAAFKKNGFRFYYVDERTPEGKGMRYISGEAHANMFIELAEKAEQGAPLSTFVKDKGYTAFAGNEIVDLPVLTLEELADLKYGAP